MKLNLKQPKYILPLLALPFLALFFYVYQSNGKAKQTEIKQQPGINGTVGEVSEDIKKKELADKLDAYRNTYKEADGYTAVSPVPVDKAQTGPLPGNYSAQQKKALDSINTALKQRFNSKPEPPGRQSDQAMIAALNHLRQKKPEAAPAGPKETDPMEIFRRQMALVDSMQKANDPEARAAAAKEKAVAEKSAGQQKDAHTLPVTISGEAAPDFNTIKPKTELNLITAVIDENMTGYAGSRLRLRLLQDITAGSTLVRKGTYVYALINGFSEQRVTLQVKSIFYEGKILPVKLDLYDTDGLPGLYVPGSAFRDFTKDLGTNTIQGVTIDDSGSGSAASQLLMSTAGKIFQSTSSAIAGIIRKDKVKLKYNTYIYLIDNKQ